MSADRCNLNSFAKSLANGTSDHEAYPKRWTAVLVHTNCEKKVAANLDKLGIENYIAVQTEEHQWSDRRKKIDRVVIPMAILFVLPKMRRTNFVGCHSSLNS